MPRYLLHALVMLSWLMAGAPALASGPAIPQHWDAGERLTQPSMSDLTRLRFLTTIDFPPFNFLDGEGRLVGFHVDLARAICAKLGAADICQIQALPWEELPDALATGLGEAAIAGLAITPEARQTMAFTRSYLRFPARFVVPRGSTLDEPVHAGIAGRRVGVLTGSSHEAMLRDYFSEAQVVAYSRASFMMRDLREGRLAAVFGDGMRLSYWLAGTESEGCCRFAGGPYFSERYLGLGLAIATSLESSWLADAFDYALRELSIDGTFAELYLRHFPVSFY